MTYKKRKKISQYIIFEMENKKGSQYSQNFRKCRTSMNKIQQQQKCNRSSYKKSNTQTPYILQLNRQEKYMPCIFTNKQNINLNIRSNQLSKYINLRTLSREKARKVKFVDKNATIWDNSKQKCQQYKTRNSLNKKVDLSIMDKSKSNKEFLQQLCIQIDHIFRHIDTLKGYGFSEKKITKWMNNFLIKKSQTLRDIFLKSYINKKSLNNSIIFERQSSIEEVTLNMEDTIQKQLQSQTIFLLSQIKSFKNYIQQIVIKKSQLNLDEIFNIGSVNPILKFNKCNQFLTSSQITHFVKDLKSIQDRYGELNSVSKVNRTMFRQILQAEQKFMTQFYSRKIQL